MTLFTMVASILNEGRNVVFASNSGDTNSVFAFVTLSLTQGWVPVDQGFEDVFDFLEGVGHNDSMGEPQYDR